MIRFIVAYDEIVADLGQYFHECKTDIVGFINEHEHIVYDNILEIPANRCNEAYIDTVVSPYNPDPFVFIAYSHGIKSALRCNGSAYVVSGVNTLKFSNAFFYSNACLIGKSLGQDLIDNGCKAFIGFEQEISAFKVARHKAISIACDNAALKYFFTQDSTIDQAVKAAKQYYTNQIDKLESFKDMVFAGSLAAAREALVVKGNGNLKKEDFFYNP